MVMNLYNTLSRKKETFKPLHKGLAGLYTCGPTVYNYAHIGNLRTYIFEDILRRTLHYNGYKVHHVMNITDVGHLTSDADEGEDKLDSVARKGGKSVWDIAKFYTEAFLRDIRALNIKKANILSPATRNIKEQIALIQLLFKKGYAYETAQAIYFDISKFKNYTELSRQKLSEKIVGAREEVVVDSEKRNPRDFALWFKLVGRFENHTMRWKSPWGYGFPGWHIECSAISTKYLGQPFDIHTGGIDHINVHHTNEIAQSEGAYGKPLARIWMHGEFLLTNDAKMAKSAGNFYTLATLTEKGFDPLAFRYLVLGTQYRKQLNFTWDSLRSAQTALENVKSTLTGLSSRANYKPGKETPKKIVSYENKFKEAINNDLNTPNALKILWDVLKNNTIPTALKKKLILDFDRVLGLGLEDIKSVNVAVPDNVMKLVKAREKARALQQFIQADSLRTKIEQLGYKVEDTAKGPKTSRLPKR
ncbi:MAG: cysteine--tRNA ligase [Candidatus Colwellbacteria bacterium]|nr:cysteine--tRNA ligase [Candidatus Colwellbacteria bacterium]